MKTNKTYRVSPSTLAIYNECKTCFYEHIHGRRRPASIFPSLPRGMDRCFKALYDENRRLETLPPEISSLGNAKLYPDQAKIDQWRNPWQGLKWHTSEGVLQGAVDEVLEINGLLSPLDFKTRSGPPRPETINYYKLQISVYTLLLQKIGHPTSPVGFLLFYHPHQAGPNGLVTFETTLVKVDVDLTKAEQTFKEALSLLRGSEPQPNSNCPYCRYKK
ncbi:MAG: PD-(D/E)XK nuclease family protein [Nanoarchaeota archaeon]